MSFLRWMEVGSWVLLAIGYVRLALNQRGVIKTLASLSDCVDAISEGSEKVHDAIVLRLDAQTERLNAHASRLDTHEQRQGVLAAIQGVQSQRVTLLVSRVNAIARRLGMSDPPPPSEVVLNGRTIVEGPVGEIVETPGAAPISVDEMLAKSRTTRETGAS